MRGDRLREGLKGGEGSLQRTAFMQEEMEDFFKLQRKGVGGLVGGL